MKKQINKCPYSELRKSVGKCKVKKCKKRKIDTGFKDKKGKIIHLGDTIKVYGELKKVKFDRAWNIDDRERCFGVTSDKQHKPLYRYRKKGIEIVKTK